MLHLLCGPDTYRSRQKLYEMIEEYQSLHGADIDIHTIDVEEDDASRIKQVAETGSLFAKQKIIVVQRACSSGKGFGEILSVLERVKVDADTLMIFWDHDLGKEAEERLAELRPLADSVQEFKPLAPAELRKWIVAEAQRRGIKISSVDLEYLVSLGSDLWAIVNELEKHAVQPEREKRHAASRAPSIFEFGDLCMAAPRRALAELPSMLASGQEEFSLYSYLVGYCRTLLIIQSYEERRESVPAQHKINPFVIRKGKTLVKSIPGQELRAMLQNFFVEDYKIKTGSSTPRDSLTRILLTRQLDAQSS